MSFVKDQIIEVEVKARRGSSRWIGQVIRATPTRVQYYYMRQSFLGFALIRRWASSADVFPATPQNQAKWKQAQRSNEELVKAHREAALSDGEPLEPEARGALRQLVKGYASSL
jgi:hypothetical protein